jgi:hypothetical protein
MLLDDTTKLPLATTPIKQDEWVQDGCFGRRRLVSCGFRST